MKIIIKRAAAAAAAVVLALGCTVFSYADSYNTIQITKSQSSKISYNGAEYTAYTGIYSVGGKNYNEHAYAVVAKPGIFTSVEVTSGSSVYGRSTLSQKIASRKRQKGCRGCQRRFLFNGDGNSAGNTDFKRSGAGNKQQCL